MIYEDMKIWLTVFRGDVPDESRKIRAIRADNFRYISEKNYCLKVSATVCREIVT
jgi:hypothetical protein